MVREVGWTWQLNLFKPSVTRKVVAGADAVSARERAPIEFIAARTAAKTGTRALRGINRRRVIVHVNTHISQGTST